MLLLIKKSIYSGNVTETLLNAICKPIISDDILSSIGYSQERNLGDLRRFIYTINKALFDLFIDGYTYKSKEKKTKFNAANNYIYANILNGANKILINLLVNKDEQNNSTNNNINNSINNIKEYTRFPK